MSERLVVLKYDGCPPSYNSYQRAHWRKQHRLKQQWQSILEGLLMVSGLSRISPDYKRRITATAELRFPTRVRRDEGNYRTPIEKALGDALQNGCWLPDDTPEFFSMGGVTFSPERGAHHMTICLVVTDTLTVDGEPALTRG